MTAARTVVLNSAEDLSVRLKKQIQQQDLDELVINYSLTSDGDVVTDSPFAFLKSLKQISFRITIGENCRSLEKLFFGCEALVSAPDMDTSRISNFNWMFENCYALQEVPEYRTDSAATMIGMFKNCRSIISLPQITAGKDTVLDSITQGCKGLTAVPHLKSPKIILDCPDDVTDVVRLRVAALDLDEIVINFSVYRKMLFGQFTETCSPFSGIGSLTRIPFKITIGPNCRSLEGLFYGCANLVELPCMDTSGITCFNAICYECVSLTGVPQLDTSRVESFQNAFHGCRSLTGMPKWDTGAATSMFGMFEGCSSLESLPEFNTGNVVRMSWFVSGCEKLTELPAFDTARAEEMSFMFNKCSSLRSIPRLSIAKVADPEKIFLGYPHQQAVAAFFGPFGLRRFRNRLLNILRRFAGKKASRGGKNGGN